MFRCKRWWNYQVLYNELGFNKVQHTTRGYPYLWENSLGENWYLRFSKACFKAELVFKEGGRNKINTYH